MSDEPTIFSWVSCERTSLWPPIARTSETIPTAINTPPAATPPHSNSFREFISAPSSSSARAIQQSHTEPAYQRFEPIPAPHRDPARRESADRYELMHSFVRSNG